MGKEIEITLPKLGESIFSATVVEWLKKEGERVEQDEAIVEVSTDKVNSEIPAPCPGILKKILVKPDEKVQVGDRLAIIEEDLSSEELHLEENHLEETHLAENHLKEQLSHEKKVERDKFQKSKKEFYSPSVLRLAKEHNLDLEKIPREGSRLTKKDVESFLEKKPPLEKTSNIEKIKLTPIRKTICENLKLANEIPSATLIT